MEILRRFGLLAGVLMLSLHTAAQSDEQDSLQDALRQDIGDADRANAHSRIAWLNIGVNSGKAEAHIDSAISLYQALGDTMGVANSHYRYGVLYRVTGRYLEATENLDKYLQHVEVTRDSFRLANGRFQKGVIYSMQGNYHRSVQEYIKTLNLYEDLGDSTGVGFTLNSLGVVQKNMEQYDRARESYERAVRLHRANNDLEDLANAVSNLGGLAMIRGNLDVAYDHFMEAMNINRETASTWGLAQSNMNLGTVLQEQGKLTEAEVFFNEAIRIQRQNEFMNNLGETLLKVGLNHFRRGDVRAAESAYLEAEALNIDSHKFKRDLHLQKYELYKKQGRLSDALEALEVHTASNDSIYDAENLKSINALQVEYETKQKDRELLANQIQIEQQATEIERGRTRNALLIGGLALLLLAGIAIMVISRQRQTLKNKQIENLTKEQEISALESFISGEEHERQRLAQDLHDGLNGDLSVVKFKVSAINESGANGHSKKDEAIDLIDAACEQVRNISKNLSPVALRQYTIAEALQQYCSRMANSSGIVIDFQHFGPDPNLGDKQKTVIYRMVQEMVNNIVKHSGANEALVQINNHGNHLNITVEDNGTGFDPKVDHAGFGLSSLNSRAAFLGASLDVQSDRQGSTFTIDLEVTDEQPNLN